MPSFTTSASESVPIPAQTTVNADGSRLPWIPSQRLGAALRSDPRTDVGEIIRELIVSRRDQTGRAELVSITGRAETFAKRLGIRADRGPRARLERPQELALYDFTFRLAICIQGSGRR